MIYQCKYGYSGYFIKLRKGFKIYQFLLIQINATAIVLHAICKREVLGFKTVIVSCCLHQRGFADLNMWRLTFNNHKRFSHPVVYYGIGTHLQGIVFQ